MDASTRVTRWDRKKAITRQALHEAALRLAVERGLDRLTVEAIADAAQVSRRTFSNYFGSKEEALFHGDRERLRHLVELVAARPVDEAPWIALTAAAVQFAGESAALDPRWRARRRLVRRHPGLAAHQMATYAEIERELAAEVARRLPAGPEAELRARVVAARFAATLRAASELWTEQPERRPLVEAVREALELSS